MAVVCDYCRANNVSPCEHDAKPPIICSAGECKRPAVITVRLIPRPHTPFSEAVDVAACSPCLKLVKERGIVLKQTVIVEAA